VCFKGFGVAKRGKDYGQNSTSDGQNHHPHEEEGRKKKKKKKKKERTECGRAGECVAAEALGFVVVATVALSRILFSLGIT
jgi:hypothetical protein